MSAVLVLADAAPSAGLGHLARAGALATALESRGETVERVGFGAEGAVRHVGAEWSPMPEPGELPRLATGCRALFLDSYLVEPELARELAGLARLVIPEDRADRTPGHALLLAPSQVEASDASTLRGFEHVCLGPDYWEPAGREPRDRVEIVLVTTGAGDPGDHGSRLAAAAAEALPAANVRLLRGPQTDDATPADYVVVPPQDGLSALLGEVDLVVTGAGQTMLEACATGTPAIAGVLAPNQRPSADRLAELGAVVAIDPADVDAFSETLVSIAGDASRRRALSAAARRAVDGRGALRVAAAVSALTR